MSKQTQGAGGWFGRMLDKAKGLFIPNKPAFPLHDDYTATLDPVKKPKKEKKSEDTRSSFYKWIVVNPPKRKKVMRGMRLPGWGFCSAWDLWCLQLMGMDAERLAKLLFKQEDEA